MSPYIFASILTQHTRVHFVNAVSSFCGRICAFRVPLQPPPFVFLTKPPRKCLSANHQSPQLLPVPTASHPVVPSSLAHAETATCCLTLSRTFPIIPFGSQIIRQLLRLIQRPSDSLNPSKAYRLNSSFGNWIHWPHVLYA